jgi:serine/threonine-protein kinase
MSDFDIGSLINDRYRVLSILGIGGQGAVYKAADTRDGDTLRAVKIAKFDSSDGADVLARVTTEYAILSKLSHPNIVRVFEAGRLGENRCFLVMEFVDGKTLADHLKSMGSLSLPEILEILHEIALGLECAHGSHVLHRDLKPANILLANSGGVKILDFGLARDLELGQSLTKTGETIGTASYMSPEQLTRTSTLDQRTDIYAFGIMAFEMTAGKPPFSDGAYHEIATAHLTRPLPEVVSPKFDVPRWLQLFVGVCCEKKKQDRYGSMQDVLKALEKPMRKMGLIASEGDSGESILKKMWRRATGETSSS